MGFFAVCEACSLKRRFPSSKPSRLRRGGRLPVDDVIDGRLGADILQAVKLIGAVEDHRTRGHALPFTV